MNYFTNPKWESRKSGDRPLVPLPCVHLGDELRAGAIALLNVDRIRDSKAELNPSRRWQLCEAGYDPVCMCNGGDPKCGPKCEGYQNEGVPETNN